MPSLSHLHLRKATDVSTQGLLSALTLEHFRHLQYLNMSECSAFNDQCVDALTQCCPNLRSLNLSWCWSITEKGLHRIVTRLHDLCCLDVVGLDQIKGGVFRDCPELYLSKLVFIDLRDCHLIEDGAIVALVRRKRDLLATNYYGELVRYAPATAPLSPGAATPEGGDGTTIDNGDVIRSNDGAIRTLLARTPGGCCLNGC